MKKLLSIILTIIMLLTVFAVIPTANAEEVSSETTETVQTDTTENTEESSRFNKYGDYTYEAVGNDAIIRKYSGKDKKVVIPSEIEGCTVKEICTFAFRENKIMEEVTIPHTVTKIRYGAFDSCTNLKKVNFGKSVKVLGSMAFADCKSLTELKIPPNVKRIRHGLIYGTSIKTLNIGKNITYVHPYAMGTNTLEKIVVNKNNKKYSSKDGVLYNKKKTALVTCPRAIQKTELKIPDSVKKINTTAFSCNKTLKKIILPKALIKIEDHAFSYCKKLRDITIPDKVKEIDWCAFANCKKLSKIKFESDRGIGVAFSLFRDCQNLKSVTMPNFYTMEDEDGGSNFSGCTSLKTVKIPSYVKEIPKRTFMDCPKLKSVTIPSTVKKIGKEAFGYVYYGENYKIKKVKGFTIKGKKGSTAYKYAKKNGFKFVAV